MPAEHISTKAGAIPETAPHPYLVLRADETFTIVAVNERYLGATGSERSAIVGRGLFEVFPDNPDDRTATGAGDLRTSLERVKRECAVDVMGVQKYDIPNPGSKGEFEVKYWSPVNTPVCAADGTLLYIIHHVEDVTDFILSREQASQENGEGIGHVQARAERMEAEVILRAGEVKEANRQIKTAMEELEGRKAELAHLNEQLKDLDRAKTAFFSNISHEFRTPLTLMLGSLQEALGDTSVGLPEVQRGRLAVAQRNAVRLLKLVNALLDFTRVEAGRTQAAFEPTDLAALTARLASHFQSALSEADLALTIDCPPLPELGLCRSWDVGDNCPEPCLQCLQVYPSRWRRRDDGRVRRECAPDRARYGHWHPHGRTRKAVRAISSGRGIEWPQP